MRTRADGRGGSTLPRPAAPDSAPGQYFVFKPWLYDVDGMRHAGGRGNRRVFFAAGILWLATALL
jgi:hypothetical protein